MNKEYQDAFNEEAVAKPEVSEDEAFGLMPEEVNGADTPEGDAPAVAIVIEPEAPAEGEAAMPEAMPEGEATVTEEAAVEGEPVSQEASEEEVSPEDMQRQKSWEGRLKKREEELKAREAELSAMAEAPETFPAVDDVAVEEAKAKLAEDFGEEFVSLIATIATGMAKKIAAETAEEKAGNIGKDIEGVIEQIRDVNERAHFERIYDAHEDFVEIANDPDFQAWVAEDAERARIVGEGHAREIVQLLNDWKASNAPAEEESGDDDTEAVRSGGLKLPAPGPGMNKDYADAWKEF
jgi:hypothetical protein